MKEDKKKLEFEHATIYQTNENCHVFNGPISGCVFAMPGATVNQSPVQQVNSKTMRQDQENRKSAEDDEPPSAEMMAAACEQTKAEGLWWGNAAWGVVFRVYEIKHYKGSTKSFVDDVESRPFKKPFQYACSKDAVRKPIQRGKITGPVEKWAAHGAQAREIKLAERLLQLLE